MMAPSKVDSHRSKVGLSPRRTAPTRIGVVQTQAIARPLPISVPAAPIQELASCNFHNLIKELITRVVSSFITTTNKMKASKYNVFFPYEDKMVGFNSYSTEYIILEPMLFEMFDACFKSKNFDDLNEVHPDFYNFLCEKEFLVVESLDELQRVKDYSYSIDNDETKYELHINPTMNCNFKCWYCYETHIKDSKMDQQTIVNTLTHVRNVLNEKKKLERLSIGWFRREPLLYFNRV